MKQLVDIRSATPEEITQDTPAGRFVMVCTWRMSGPPEMLDVTHMNSPPDEREYVAARPTLVRRTSIEVFDTREAVDAFMRAHGAK